MLVEGSSTSFMYCFSTERFSRRASFLVSTVNYTGANFLSVTLHLLVRPLHVLLETLAQFKLPSLVIAMQSSVAKTELVEASHMNLT